MNNSIVALFVLLLISCDNPATAPDASTPAAAQGDGADNSITPYEEFNTSITIRDIMNTFIDPSADAIWQAVRFEMDETGTREIYPETDEEWEVLRKHAISIIEGANALMIPGRAVAPPGSTTEFPAYEYLPEEVEKKFAEDRTAWLVFAQGLQTSTLSVMDAIVARDVTLLSEYGALVDQACENCHSQYWYRAESL